ncbi:hypothetical protein DRF62_02105 [Chryseobacterium piscium]|uniref:Major capsid protein E n=1 Tax=Chryseobacterium piscium TaxID=333702 RepID=A0A3D9BTX4_9FLAO|nr:major capsid protein [Chryseobacterium piscium]REC56973.1 hypothetical protein DRF62_02105 [Chryseobacterium piscium]
MAKEASVFGSVADQETTQIMIDTRLEKFNQPWYSKYFSFALPQISLTYTTVLGNSTITPAASFVTRDGETPLRSRETLQSLTGKIPPIKVMRDLDEEKYRNYMVLQDMKAIKDNEKKNQALKLIWDDLKYVTEAVDKRLDYTVAEAISTGTITITADNNPDGIVVGTIELEMPTENKINASVDWSDTVNSKPITDITNLVNGAYSKGKTFAKMLIDNTAFLQFMQSKEVKETVGTFFGLSAAARNSQTAPLTSDRINEYMTAAKLPVFEIVDIRVPIEKDGNVSILQPFKAANIAFIPEGNLGEIKNALAMEEMKPVEHVTYNKKGRTLISKWSANEPWGEWTKAELNAFPVVDTIKYIYLLSTTGDF